MTYYEHMGIERIFAAEDLLSTLDNAALLEQRLVLDRSSTP